ncbi:MAG: hypothetical protein Q7S89_02385 [bacterium]|nr:hypothetical protein [bacterium]
MKVVLIWLLTIIAMYVLAYYVALYFGMAYGYLFPRSLGGGSLIPVAATEWIRGISLALIFLIVLSFNLLKGKKKWWWVAIATSPAILFELWLDPLHIYVPIILALIGWGLGTLANKTLLKVVPGVMAKIG